MSLTAFRSSYPGNSMVASLQMSILPQLDLAVTELTSLQETISLGTGGSLSQVQQAYDALAPLDDALPQGELEEIALNLQTESPSITATRIARNLDRIKERADRLRNHQAAIYTENDVRMYRSIVGEAPSLAPSFLAKKAATFQIPGWAQTLIAKWAEGDAHEYPIWLQNGSAIVGSSSAQGATSEIKSSACDLVSPQHFEIRFTPNGRYWIRDLGSEAGTLLNGERLRSQKWHELEDNDEIGFQLEEGHTIHSLKITFQDRDRLEALRDRIEKASDFTELLDLLSADAATLEENLRALPKPTSREIRSRKATTVRELRQQIENVRMFVETGVGLGAISESGGLARRARQLNAERECEALEPSYENLHQRYAGTLPEQRFLPHYQKLAQEIQKARSYQSILTAMRNSMIPRLTEAYAAVSEFSSGNAEAFRNIPTDFGMRAKVRDIAATLVPANAKSELEKIHVSLDDYFMQPWNQTRVSQALRLTLAGLRQKGGAGNKDQRDFRELMTLIEGWDTHPASYIALKPTDPTEADIFDHEEGPWRYLGNLYPQSPFNGRIDLVIPLSSEQAVWQYLNDKLFAIDPTPFQLRMPKAGAQSDPEVVAHLYFHPQDQQVLYQILTALAADHPEFLRDQATPFTLPVKNSEGNDITGVRLSQIYPVKPGKPDARINAMREAVNLIDVLQKAGRPQNWNAIYQIFAYFFQRAGFDPSQPALLSNGETELGALLHPPQVKKSRKTVRDVSGVQPRNTLQGRKSVK